MLTVTAADPLTTIRLPIRTTATAVQKNPLKARQTNPANPNHPVRPAAKQAMLQPPDLSFYMVVQIN